MREFLFTIIEAPNIVWLGAFVFLLSQLLIVRRLFKMMETLTATFRESTALMKVALELYDKAQDEKEKLKEGAI